MMKKSTSTIITFFVSFALLSASLSANANVFAQNATDDVIPSIPPQEPLLPDETTTATAQNTTIEEPFEISENEATGSTTYDHGNATSDKITVTRDSQTILLDDSNIPAGDFIHLYDSTPYKIMSGHVAAKIPCNDDNSTGVNVLVGQAPNLTQAELEFIPELSTTGELCMYHTDITSDETTTITDIAIQNNSTEDEIDFPATSTVVIGVNEISSLSSYEHSHNE